MSEKIQKNCPFNHGECNSSCALFISIDDVNELFGARLASLGVIDRENGTCSLKMTAMSLGRQVFENTSTKRF